MLGLHFDLTVPFARYVLENAGRLEFPFKRYQIQKVWRGERPQQGRFREFTQADIDVVGQGTLPFQAEVDLPLVMAEALVKLPIGPVEMLVNNRKLAEGFYRGLGLGAAPDESGLTPAADDQVMAIFRVIDKLDKIGPATTAELLVDQAQLSATQAAACLELAQIHGDTAGPVIAAVQALADRHQVRHPLLELGLTEFETLLTAAAEAQPGVIQANLKIARGLDYYTGSVYETFLVGQTDLGSICSGGRYDSLVSSGQQTYPGVGLSIGLSRLVSRLIGQDLVQASRPVPTAVMVAVNDEASRAQSNAIARQLRQRGIPTEVAPVAAKFGKQIKFADRRQIPYVWFPGVDGQPDQVKDIRHGDQVAADADDWCPPADDWWPRLVSAETPV
jgi:histidyl-tRNA synthetase